ncbi:radical SAM protein [bacterium]|nr:radical SAM protein [bacterium]
MSRYFFKRLKDEFRRRLPFDRALLNGYSLPPLRIDIELTHNCNLKCTMCSFVDGNEINKYFSNPKRSKHESAEEYPSIERWKRFINDISSFKPTINLSGGEPLIFPHLWELLDLLKEKRFITTMTTNASLINEEIAEKLVRSDIDALVISIDGDRGTHDRIRGVNGSFDKALQGIKHIKDLKTAMGSRTPRLVINTTISWENYSDLSFVKKLFPEILPYKWNISHLFLGNGDIALKDLSVLYNERDDIKPLKVIYGRIDTATLGKEIRELRSSSLPISFLPSIDGEKLKAFYEDPAKTLRNKCSYPYFSVGVQGDGTIITCMYTPMGTIDDDFRSIWNSDRYKEFRQMLNERIFSKCSRCCGLYE